MNYQGWKKLFLFCLGLFAGTAFCMKWMEGDFRQNGQVFTIIGLEISYTEQKLTSLFSGLDEKVKTILRYHLYFDFAFMTGVYPGIAALCMMARDKIVNPVLRRSMFILALLQALAFACDITENSYLLEWIRNPEVAKNFGFYHLVVMVKWIIALTGALLAIPLAIKKRQV